MKELQLASKWKLNDNSFNFEEPRHVNHLGGGIVLFSGYSSQRIMFPVDVFIDINLLLTNIYDLFLTHITLF